MIEELSNETTDTKEQVIKKTMEEKIKAEYEDLFKLDKQISALTEGEANGDQNQKFNLQAELESLVQPFVKMVKDATENARQIESLKRSLLTAEQQQELDLRTIEPFEVVAVSGRRQV